MMLIDLHRREVAPRSLARPTPAPRPPLGFIATDAASYDKTVKTIVVSVGVLTLIWFGVRSDIKRGFYSGKPGKGITNEEALTRLIAIGGAAYFLWPYLVERPAMAMPSFGVPSFGV